MSTQTFASPCAEASHRCRCQQDHFFLVFLLQDHAPVSPGRNRLAHAVGQSPCFRLLATLQNEFSLRVHRVAGSLVESQYRRIDKKYLDCVPQRGWNPAPAEAPPHLPPPPTTLLCDLPS